MKPDEAMKMKSVDTQVAMQVALKRLIAVARSAKQVVFDEASKQSSMQSPMKLPNYEGN